MFDRRTLVASVLASAVAAPALAALPPGPVSLGEREVEQFAVALMGRVVEARIANGGDVRFSIGGLSPDAMDFEASDGTIHRVSNIVAGDLDELIDVLAHVRSDANFLRVRGIKRRADGSVSMIYVMGKSNV